MDHNFKKTDPSSICELALKYKLIDKKQLVAAVSDFKKKAPDHSASTIEDYLVECHCISKAKMNFLKKMRDFKQTHRRDKHYARVLVEGHKANQEQIKEAFGVQARLFKEKKRVVSIADILLKSGVVTAKVNETIWQYLQNINEPNDTAPEEASSAGSREEAENPGSDDHQDGEIGQSAEEPAPDAESPEVNMCREDCSFEKLALSLSDDGIEAFIRNTMSPTDTMTVAEVKAFLDEKGICRGIVDDALIDGFLTSAVFREKPFRVARGEAPEYGSDAVITYYFENEGLKSGKLTEEGKIDFRERGTPPFVKKDELLVEKRPARKSEAGINVYGETFRPPAVKDPAIFAGKGTRLSEDGLKLYAMVDGQPLATMGHKVSVFTEMKIDGDVGFKTGHIEFDGNVVVKGVVKDGFRVQAASLKAVDITGGEIHLTGDAVISGTISESTIYTRGSVEATTIRKSTIYATGSVVARKMIIDSTIENSGSCIVEYGRIVSSNITSKMGIQASEVGTEVSAPCRLCAGLDKHLVREMKGIEKGLERRRKQLSIFEEQQKTLEAQDHEIQEKSTVLAHVQDRSTLALRDLKQKLAQMTEEQADQEDMIDVQKEIAALQLKAKEAEQKIEQMFDKQETLVLQQQDIENQIKPLQNEINALEAEKEAILEWSRKEKGIAIVETRGAVQAGTVVSGVHARTVLKETVRRSSIKEIQTTDPDAPVKWEMRIQN